MPGIEIGGASTRVLCRGRLPKVVEEVEAVALGGGADGIGFAGVNLSRTSI